jgi:protein N-terminal methyltransferase
MASKSHTICLHPNGGMEASDSGMLDGFEATSPSDVAASREFIQQFVEGLKDYNLKIKTERCIDVGAGIGRISKLLLAQVFNKVDLLEQNQQFIDKAKEELTAPSSTVAKNMGEFYCSPLQTFEFPADKKYDVIWIQWVLLYLLDVDLIAFLKRCKAALQPHGIIIVKENVGKDSYLVDMGDNSISRTPTHFKSVFASAGLKLIRDEEQPDWPQELLPVRMWALL